MQLDEVISRWYDREGTREEWQNVAKEKGFDDWKSWRMSYLEKFDLLNEEWEETEISYKTLSEYYVGPYEGWKQYYDDRTNSRFIDICEKLKDHSKVKDILKHPPKTSEFIAVTDGDRYMLIEGHHRASAFALAVLHNIDLNVKVIIQQAKISNKHFDHLLNLQ